MKLLIRADASAEIGTGHVMRCLALAQAWQESGGSAVFLGAIDAAPIRERLVSESFEVRRAGRPDGGIEDAAETSALAREVGAEWIVVDGYHFGADYQRALKDAGLRVLFIDDNGHAGEYCADIVLNQNIHADETLYAKRRPGTRLLLGTRYVLLRKEFWPWREWKREIPEVARKILVTMGGGDPDNATTKVVRALDLVEVEGLEAVVVVGGSNRRFKEIRTPAGNSRPAVRVERNVTNMPELMAWADVAVSAGGSTCWELGFMRLPALLVSLIGHQTTVIESLVQLRVAISLGPASHWETETVSRALTDLLTCYLARRKMAEASERLFDDYTPGEAVQVLKGTASGGGSD